MEKKSHCPDLIDDIERHFDAKGIHFEPKWHTIERSAFLSTVQDSDKILVAVGASRKTWHHAFCLEKSTNSPTGWLAIYSWGKSIDPAEKTFDINTLLSEKENNQFFKTQDDQLWIKARDGWYVFSEAEVIHEDGKNEIVRSRSGPFKNETEAKAEAHALKVKNPHVVIDGVAQQHQLLNGEGEHKYWYIFGDTTHAPNSNEGEVLHEKIGPFLTKENAEHALKTTWKFLENAHIKGTKDEPKEQHEEAHDDNKHVHHFPR